jgi:hypothetical protein
MSVRNPRYDHRKPQEHAEAETPYYHKGRDSLEIIEDCAEDLEDEVVPSLPNGNVTPSNMIEMSEPTRQPYVRRGRKANTDGTR